MKRRTYEELFPDLSCPVLIASPQNIFYTIGFHTTARRPAQIGLNCVLMTREQAFFLFPAGWRPLVEEQLNPDRAVLVPYSGKTEKLAEKLAELLDGTDQIGFEQDGLELSLYLELGKALEKRGGQMRWLDISGHMNRARLIKSPEEIEALRVSAKAARDAMEHAKKILRPGVREMDVVVELEYHMRKAGSEGVPFTMKVLSGENAVRTINLPGDRQIQRGDVVLLDFGAVVCHYASDWTRSFAIGSVGKEQQELYETVWKIERECIGMIRPGVSYQDLMDCAMEVLKGNPLAEWFNPYLGHSIGISSQEQPTIVSGADMVLQENMVITIEPGIYVPGLGGVRIEDEVLVTADGHEILTGLQEEGFLIPLET